MEQDRSCDSNPSSPARMSQSEVQVGRSASESAGSEKSRISVIEKSVTHLLVATKTLLETLTKWSKQQATETEVSDVYVRLGYEFNIACRAFKSVGVETSDLGPVPDLLRGILEETLSGEPSHYHLDKYLPQIRDIIVNLLQGLKRKQQKLRQRYAKERESSSASSGSTGADVRHSSSLSAPSAATDQRSANGEDATRQSWRTDVRRQDGVDAVGQDPSKGFPRPTSTHQPPQRTDSGRAAQPAAFIPEPTLYPSGPAPPTERAHDPPPPVPKAPPYPHEDTVPEPSQQTLQAPSFDSPQQQRSGDALAALQRGGELERRASRRFSAYQIQKHLGTSTSGIALIPPPQHSPIPNRGRDLKESMNAVRTRGSNLHIRDGSKNKYTFEVSPTRPATQPEPASEKSSASISDAPTYELPAESSPINSPFVKTPEDKLRQSYLQSGDGPWQSLDENVQPKPSSVTVVPTASFTPETPHTVITQNPSSETLIRHPSPKQAAELAEREESPAADGSTGSGELTIFLQYKTRIKKFVLADGYEELSIPRLQLAFIEKFAWNTHSNGVDLPEIYVQDPVSGVRHELEDLGDVKNHSVLALNVDAVDEVKKHMDDGLSGLRALMQDVRSAITDQTSVLQRVAEKQQDTAKDVNRIASQPPQPVQQGLVNGAVSKVTSPAQLSEVQSLRRDLAVLRQTYTSWVADMESSMATVRSKADAVKTLASQQPSLAADVGDGSTGRAYVTSGRKTLNSTSEAIMTRVEDLQDTVEDLRKDVVTRGVRPLPRQLETVSKELSAATSELKKLQDFIRREKPTWTKIWKNELQVVCEDQNLLTYQEELAVDLEADLAAATETFALVEEATKQQNLTNSAGVPGAPGSSTSGSRNTSRTLNPTADPLKAKDSLLGEVKALQPNHETRLEAIERAERMRQKELAERKDGEFKKELTGFVDEGRLKKSGGFEEAERVRKVKDERMRKQVWDRINGRVESPEPEASASSSQIDAAAASLNSMLPTDIGSLAGSGLPPEVPGADKADAAIAESASVPLPLEVHEHIGPASPDAEFVEAPEQPPER